jgi:hypothetical protein
MIIGSNIEKVRSMAMLIAFHVDKLLDLVVAKDVLTVIIDQKMKAVS